MAVCCNKNTKEYKALQGEFKSPYLVDSIIRDFQTINKSDNIPTIDQAKEVINDIKSVINDNFDIAVNYRWRKLQWHPPCLF